MSRPTMRRVLPVLVALATMTAMAQEGVAQASGAPAQPVANRTTGPADRRADEQAIRELSMQWLAAQKRKDVAGVMVVFASDASAVYSGKLLTGADAIRRNYESDLVTMEKARPGLVPSWQTTAVSVAESGEMAYESGTYDDSWNGGKDRERGNYLTVWRKVGDAWKVAYDMAVPEAKPAKPAP